MSKSEKVLDEAKENLDKVPKKTGPAGLLIVFYLVAAFVGLLVIAWFFGLASQRLV